MLSIPLPFVLSILLLVLAGNIFVHRTGSTHMAAYFLVMCAATTTLVGLRWLMDWSILRTIQPIAASAIPVMAWWVFSRAYTGRPLTWWHGIIPVSITVKSLAPAVWMPSIDLMLMTAYIFYSTAFWRAARSERHTPENVPLTNLALARFNTQMASLALLATALVDVAISLNFIFWDGAYSMFFLSMGHIIMLPVLALAVVWIGANTQADSMQQNKLEESSANKLSSEDAKHIISLLEDVICEQKLFLDPNLTLNRLARKAGIPGRLVSSAVNQNQGRNLSHWINGYRIEEAKKLLKQSNKPVSEIYLEAGFQTKSNFHREFSRQVGSTPTDYRKAMTSSA